MSNDRHATNRFGSDVTPEAIEAAIQRGRVERSKAFWALFEAVFGRPGERDSRAAPLDDRTVHGVR